VAGPGDLVEGTGVWPDLAVGPGSTLGVVFYDRTNGDLVGAAYDGAAWSPTQTLAGENGDVGWAPSLAIDGEGTWHMTAVDGITEDLIYLTSAGTYEIVDGRSLGEHDDLRGDDSSILVFADGSVRVAYQDATALELWVAERDTAGLWSTSRLEGAGVGATAAEGFFVGHTPHGASSVVSSWYFDAQGGENGVSLFWL
jgi:hypothetical protein